MHSMPFDYLVYFVPLVIVVTIAIKVNVMAHCNCNELTVDVFHRVVVSKVSLKLETCSSNFVDGFSSVNEEDVSSTASFTLREERVIVNKNSGIHEPIVPLVSTEVYFTISYFVPYRVRVDLRIKISKVFNSNRIVSVVDYLPSVDDGMIGNSTASYVLFEMVHEIVIHSDIFIPLFAFILANRFHFYHRVDHFMNPILIDLNGVYANVDFIHYRNFFTTSVRSNWKVLSLID